MSLPHFHRPTPGNALALLLTGLSLVSALGLVQLGEVLDAEELLDTSLNFSLGYRAATLATLTLGFLALMAWSRLAPRLLGAFGRLQGSLARLRPLALPLGFILIAAYCWLVYGFYGRFLTSTFTRLTLFAFFALALAALFATWRRGTPWLQNLLIAVLGLALLHNASTFFIEVNNYPFSLAWSEVSRYYQASFYFSASVYGVELPLPVTHPSRYLLQSLPFAFGDLPIWVHRFWQSLLWMLMPAITAWALLRRLKIRSQPLAWLFGAWVFLYLMQGAVFYHLLPAVFIVLLTFDRRRPWRSFAFMALAAAWAGISRINWAPFPGALAALLYLLDAPLPAGRTPFNLAYWRQPALHFVGGGLVALGAYWLYIQTSGVEDLSQFSSSFTSALLWERLGPNSAFPPGILPGILLVSSALVILIVRRLRQPRATLGRWRTLAVLLILLVFFAGGLVVSVKIGGGTNLHNMDAYMVLLLVFGAHLLFGRYTPQGSPAPSEALNLRWRLVAWAVLLPVIFAVLPGAPPNLPDEQLVQRALERIRAYVDEANAQNREVLFISERHLLTFHMVDAPLVHEYEKLFLMEMAISNNSAYLAAFEDDLEDKRFEYIITDPLNLFLRESEQDPLYPENNTWVQEISTRVLCHYREVVSFDPLGIQILEPRYADPCR